MTRPGPAEARVLFRAVSDGVWRGGDVFAEVLAPAMPAWSGFARDYARYRRLASAPPFAHGRTDPHEDLWTFYALSRVHEHLLFGLQDAAGLGRKEPGWPRHPVAIPSRDDLLRFFGALGMEPMEQRARYHPFFHEVAGAEVDLALGDAVIVEEELWPGLWFGDLVFARAGVRVRCGRDSALDPHLAARSTLYFAWERVHRPTSDLSHGWGSGSQWGTPHRRDYADGATLRYNVDGRVRVTAEAVLPGPDGTGRVRDPAGDDLTPAERLELLVHRCFVRTTKPHGDRWPFHDTAEEPAPGPDADR